MMPPPEKSLPHSSVPTHTRTPSSSRQGRPPIEPLLMKIPSPTDPPPFLPSGDTFLGKRNSTVASSTQLEPLRRLSTPPSSSSPLSVPTLSSPIVQDKFFFSATPLVRNSVLVDPLSTHATSLNGTTTVRRSNEITSFCTSPSNCDICTDIITTGSAPRAVAGAGSRPVVSEGSLKSSLVKKMKTRRHNVVPPVQPISSSTPVTAHTQCTKVNGLPVDTSDINTLSLVKMASINPNTVTLAPVHPRINSGRGDDESKSSSLLA